MSFNQNKDRRDQGEREPKGFTKRKILLKIAKKFPEDIEEPPLRDYLKENFRIRTNKGIKNHLSDLKQEKCLQKESRKGKRNIWRLRKDYQGFKHIFRRFLIASEKERERDRIIFSRSQYTQEIVDEDFVDYFAPKWAREYTKYRQGYLTEDSHILGIPIKEIDDAGDDKLRTKFYKNSQNLNRKKLSEILKVSPSALTIFLFPEKVFKDQKPFRFYNVYFLYPFALDSITIGAPNGKAIETNLKIKYGDFHSAKEKDIEPIIETKSDYKTIGGSGKGKDANNKSK